MDLREMRYVLELAKTKHMTAAANNLYISQPALYKSLKKIEHELDTSLFYKKDGELLPTDTGRIVIEKSQEILKMAVQMEDAITAAKNLKQGNVSFGFTSVIGTMYLPDLFIQFQKKYPGIKLVMREEGGTKLADLVEKGEIDMAIVMRPVHSDMLNEIPLIKNQLVACVPENHPWAEKTSVTINDFENMPIITFNENFNVYGQIMEHFRAVNLQPQFAFLGADGQFLYKYAMASNNVAILPKPMVNLFQTDEKIKVIPFSPTFSWELCLVFPKNTFLSSASKALITFIQEYLLIKYY